MSVRRPLLLAFCWLVVLGACTPGALQDTRLGDQPLKLTGPQSVAFSGPEGGPFDAAHVLNQVTNVSQQPVSWSVRSSHAWLAAMPDQGVLQPNQRVVVESSVDQAVAAELPPGTYQGAVVVTTTGGTTLPITFTLTVTATTGTDAGVVDAPAPSPDSGVDTTVDTGMPATEGRVQIVNNNVVTAAGDPLVGEHLLVTTWNLGRLLDPDIWDELRADPDPTTQHGPGFRFNVVRLLTYQYPVVAWSDPGNPQHIMSAQAIRPHLRAAVDLAKSKGMYVIIDYHTVGGYVAADVLAWWSVIAPEFKDDWNVIYEAINEPVAWTPNAYSSADIAFQATIYNHIRGLAPDTHIILWSFANTANMLAAVQDPAAASIDYSNASVGFHPYDSESAEPGGIDMFDVNQLRAHYPCIATEAERSQEFGYSGDYNPIFQNALANDVSIISLAGYPKSANGVNYLIGEGGVPPLLVTW